ncbi:MAG: hypothetical protein AABO58_12375 [Acidobacteriota bacterium]
MSEKAQRDAALEAEHEWFKRHPRMPHEAMLVARELRSMFDRLKDNLYAKNATDLWEKERVRQSWARLRERWLPDLFPPAMAR